MKKIPQALEDKLLEYIDGKLHSSELESFESLLNQDTNLSNRLEELRLMNTMMRQIKIDQPSKNFTDLVMSNLNRKPVRSILSIRNGIFLIAGVLVTIGIASYLISIGTFDNTTTVIDLNTINISRKYIDKQLPSLPFNGKIMVNIIIMLNLALVFVVLDRIILKPYFRRRMQSSH
jgi:hypothetical protein